MKMMKTVTMIALAAIAFVGSAQASVKLGGYEMHKPFNPNGGAEGITTLKEDIYVMPIPKKAESIERKYFQIVNIPTSHIAPQRMAARGIMKNEKSCRAALEEVAKFNKDKYGTNFIPVKSNNQSYALTYGFFDKDGYRYVTRVACNYNVGSTGAREHQLFYEIETREKLY